MVNKSQIVEIVEQIRKYVENVEEILKYVETLKKTEKNL